ncbi:MAG: recombinase family protein [Dehalococcoidales bacterium]|nr:recombinase family protein [Dehalococcoidales bacterium]
MTKRAVIYSRVSTPEQAEDDKTSLTEQERLCREYCQEKGYSLSATYQDIGSGTTRKRPSFMQMLKEAKQDVFDVIIAWKTDRLARGIYPCSALMEAIEESDITIETVAEPFDRTTFEIRAVLGRIEVENIVQRTTMGREAKMKAGHHHVKPAYGYDYDLETHQWVINKIEAQWVEQIFKWYIDGISPNRISQRLNAEGVQTKLDSRLGWAEKTVSDLVCQEYYAGRCLRNVGRHDKKQKSPDKWIHIPAPRIISDETWEAAQARRSQNKVRSPRNTKRTYITQHVLECEECGTRFHVASGWGGVPRLMCFRMIRYPHSAPCRLPKSVEYDRVADQLWGGVVKVVGSEEGLEAAMLANINRVKGKKETIERRLKEVTTKRANFSAEKDRVISWARKGSITEEQLERQLKDITDEDAEYIVEQNRLLSDLRIVGNGDEVYQQAREYIPMMKSRLNDRLTEADKLEMIDTLVHRARLDGSGDLIIEFKTPRPEMSFGYLSS